MSSIAASRPFMIELPSGTKLYGITRTDYNKEGGVVKPSDPVKGSQLYYYIETTRADWETLSDDIRGQYAPPGQGGPKFYKIAGIYNKNGDAKWSPVTAGAELQQEFAAYDAGKPTQIRTVVATSPQSVAEATGTSASGLAQILFKPNNPPTVAPSPTSLTQQGGAGGTGDTPPKVTVVPYVDEVGTKPFKNVIEDGKIINYPIELEKTNQDVIKFSVYDVKTDGTGGRVSSNSGTSEAEVNLKFQFNPREFVKKGGDVILPIQAAIGDQNAVDWSGSPLNAIDAATYDLSYRLMQNTDSQIGETLYGAATAITQAVKGQQGRIQRYFAGIAANQNNILARTDNVILNPNLELLFNAPTLRPFNFTFKLSARQKTESNNIKTIIRFFKANMAVRREVNNIFLRAPLVFKIQYLYRNKEEVVHPGLNLIKMCALTNMSVDYTPLGTYMTYDDGTMVSYTINLQFQELTPIYQDDYENFSYGEGNTVPNHPIGP